MINLLKAEFTKIRKEKTFLISLVIVIVASILISFLYLGLELMVNNQAIEEIPLIEFTGKGIFLGSFSPTQNVGIIIPIVLSMIITREFSYGTIRNKVISGHDKTTIFLSIAIVNLIIGLFLFLINLLSSLLFGSLIMGYGSAMTVNEFLFILKSIGLGLLIYSSIIMFTILISMTVKSLGPTLIIVILSLLFLSLLGTLNQLPGVPDNIESIISIIPTYQLVNLTNIDTYFVLKSIITAILLNAVFIMLGIYIFNKQDLK